MSLTHLIEDGPLSGHVNMDKDRQLFARFQPGDAPLVRFYQWAEPTVSLGRFQKKDRALHTRIAELGLPLVYRPTGGQAILHKGDLCISVIAAPPTPHILNTHQALAQGYLKAFHELGLSAELGREITGTSASGHCFEKVAPVDLHLAGKKLLGCAMMRSRHAFLQQSVLYLDFDKALAKALFGEAQGVAVALNDHMNIPLEVLKDHLFQGLDSVLGTWDQ